MCYKFKLFVNKFSKKDIVLSVLLLVVFFYFFVFPFLVVKFNQSRALIIFLLESGYNGKKTGLTIYDQEKTYPGVILISSFGGSLDKDGKVDNKNNTFLINKKGEVINKWPIVGFPAKLLPGGFIVGSRGILNTHEDPHQESGEVVEMNWQGDIVWNFNKWELNKEGNYIARSHHAIEQINVPTIYTPNIPSPATSSERTLILSHENILKDNINSKILEDDVLLEVGLDGSILWKWLASDHFEEFGFTGPMKEAIFNSKPIRFALLNQIGEPFSTVDWLHINFASYLGPNIWYDQGDKRFSPDNIMISSRSGCFVAIIERQTGKIVWRLGPDYKNEPEKSIGQIIGQHNAYIIPKGLPGEGDVILVDNGGFSCYGSTLGVPTFPNNFRNYSRILEINPVTLKVVWEYSQPKSMGEQKEFFSWNMCSVQRLPNGNTLIAESQPWRLFEITPSKEIVYEYYIPFHRTILNSTGISYLYSAFNYPSEWTPK